MTDIPVILPTSAEAATYRTDVKGWVSRHGHYFGADERLARLHGCTHNVCTSCGARAEKDYLFCDACQAKRDAAAWEALPLVEWDGETPLCLWRGDTYLYDIDQVRDYAAEHDMKVSELRLVLCKPVCARRLEVDYWADDLEEGDDAPSWLEDAVDEFNEVIAAHRNEPLSWRSGQQRVVLDPLQPSENAGSPGEESCQS